MGGGGKIYIHVNIHIYIYTYAFRYVCMYVCMYGFVCICIHIYGNPPP